MTNKQESYRNMKVITVCRPGPNLIYSFGSSVAVEVSTHMGEGNHQEGRRCEKKCVGMVSQEKLILMV